MKEPEERWLDEMLDTVKPVEPSAALRRAVAEIPLRHPQAASGPEFAGFEIRRGLALRLLLAAVLAAAAGVLVGRYYQSDLLPEQDLAAETPSGTASPEQTEEEQAWEELAVLAFSDALDEELVP